MTLHEKHKAFFIISHSFILRFRNVWDKSCRENQNTHFVFNNFVFKNSAFYEIMWKNTVERGRAQIILWRMRFASWTPKATNTHWEYVIFIAFPLQTVVARTRLIIALYIHCIYWVNPLNPELNPICYLLALLAHCFLHVSRIRVKSLTLRLLMSYIYIYIYIYGTPILDVSRSYTATRHSR